MQRNLGRLHLYQQTTGQDPYHLKTGNGGQFLETFHGMAQQAEVQDGKLYGTNSILTQTSTGANATASLHGFKRQTPLT